MGNHQSIARPRKDSKRSAMFSKLSRIITVAAKQGGDPNPENNASLRRQSPRPRATPMPKDKIKAAIDKAFGSGADAANFEEVTTGLRSAGIGVRRVPDRQSQPYRRRRAQRLLAFGW